MDTLCAPFIVPGYEPTPAGEPKSAEERKEVLGSMKQMRLVQAGIESPAAKAAMSGAMGQSRILFPRRCIFYQLSQSRTDPAVLLCPTGFGIGAFFSLMSSSFAIEDPLRAPQYANLSTQLKVKEVFKDMGKGMWKSGSGFARVGALYAGSECVIEGVSRRFYPLLPPTPHDPTHHYTTYCWALGGVARRAP